MGFPVIAVINWRPAALLRENVRFFEKAEQAGRVRPKDRVSGSTRNRALVLRADGSCEMQRFTAATVVRRMLETQELKRKRKARNGESG